MIGCSVAYALCRKGVSVTIVDTMLPGRASSASAGGLWPIGESIGLGCGVILHEAQSKGKSGASSLDGPEPLPRTFMDFLIESNRRFPVLAEELLKLSGIDIEVESGTGLIYLIYTEKQEVHARRLLDYLGTGEGLVEKWTPKETRKREPMLTRNILGGVYFPGDNQVNPMFLAEALKCSAIKIGARLLPETKVTDIHCRGDFIVEVMTSNGSIPCGALVNAAGAWSAQIAKMVGIELPVYPVRGQMLCTETLKETLNCNLSTPDCYILQKAHGEIIIGSTTENCDFDVRVKHEDLCRLAAGALRAIPKLHHANLKRTWAGLRPGTPDELPILGPVPGVRNYFNATGGFRTGVVAAPLTGEIVAAQVVEEDSPFPDEPFLLSRFAGQQVGPQASVFR